VILNTVLSIVNEIYCYLWHHWCLEHIWHWDKSTKTLKEEDLTEDIWQCFMSWAVKTEQKLLRMSNLIIWL